MLCLVLLVAGCGWGIIRGLTQTTSTTGTRQRSNSLHRHLCFYCSMRASASDTALDRLDAATVGVQRFLSRDVAAGAAAGSAAGAGLQGRLAAGCHATPPRAAARAASQPVESAPDPKLRRAAARTAMSARLPDVRPPPPCS